VRRVLAAVLAVAAAVAAVLAFHDDKEVASHASGAVATPLWSPRRVPGLVVDAVGAQKLQAALDATAGGAGSCFVVESGGHVVATHGVDTPLPGASTEKLVTAAAALQVMGPDFKYETKAVAPAAVNNGSIDRLWLVGAGDPLLVTADYAAYLQAQGVSKGDTTTSLEALAAAVVAMGVRRIPGGVVGDDSRYDQQREVPTWKVSYRADGEVGSLGALSVNEGFSTWTPRKTPAADPALTAAQQLSRLLAARGVTVGAATHGTAPASTTPIASVLSPSLHDIVATMLRSSDNGAAELLAKEVGVRVAKDGSTAAGVKSVVDTVHQLGVPTAGVSLVDGSGLDRGNRVTCNALAATLALGEKPALRGLWDGLPVAGQSGTLFDRLKGTPLDGKLRAKTGSLDGVTGLVGFLDSGRAVRFAFVDAGLFSENAGILLREKVAGVLARYPDAPPPDALVPGPAAPTPPAATVRSH
jgi:D-alanyl-D-alanine carboxypeptidase/D-alanyl-D-alanine-endopeptidase (penicillin-binding protein 4)